MGIRYFLLANVDRRQFCDTIYHLVESGGREMIEVPVVLNTASVAATQKV